MRIVRAVAVVSVVWAAAVVLLLAISPDVGAGLAAPGASILSAGSVGPGISASAAYTSYLPLLARGFYLRIDPNDALYTAGYQWALERVKAPQAWYVSKGDAVTVAVVDTGLDLAHPDLVGSLWLNPGEIDGNGLDDDGNGYIDDVHGWDFVGWDGAPWDGYGHGTHVAGIVGAVTDNGIGVAGMGWGARVMVVRVLDDSGNGGIYEVSQGIRYAADNGARVINLSLGGYYSEPPPVLGDAIAYAQGKGALVIAAAGNDNTSYAFCPASCSGVIGVAATDSDDRKADFSNHGSYVDIAAPGVSIYSTKPRPTDYAFMSGTSMATPMVSGLAALLWTHSPTATASQVWTAIRTGAQDLGDAGWDPYFGWGRIDAVSALYSVSLAGEQAQMETVKELSAPIDLPAPYRSGEVIVALRSALSVQDVGLSVIRADPRADLYLLRVPEGEEMASVQALRERADVVYAHPNYTMSVTGR